MNDAMTTEQAAPSWEARSGGRSTARLAEHQGEPVRAIATVGGQTRGQELRSLLRIDGA